MILKRPVTGRPRIVPAVAVLLLLSGACAFAAEQFPFDQELTLDAAPMRPGKRMPMLGVAPNGDAAIGLWCKTVPAHVEFSDNTIKIDAGPLPDALPEMMGRDQCTPARIQADSDLLSALTQVATWHLQGSAVVLVGPKTLKFRPPTN